MKFYRIDDQIIFADKQLTVGTELIANTSDGAMEKHVPVIFFTGSDVVKIEVGEIEHPSLEQHYIEWIVLETNTGIHTKWLKPGMKPETAFTLQLNEKPVAAYEYCNLHGLWKKEV